MHPASPHHTWNVLVLTLPHGPGGVSVEIHCRLTLPPDPVLPATAFLLVPGGTYNHAYWDLPDPAGGTDRYSFVAAASRAGFASLAVDTLGRGRSSRPASSVVTLAADAWICDQLAQRLKTAGIAGPDGQVTFERVVAVGHSLGTGTIWALATDHDSIDGAILTGNTHFPNGQMPTFIRTSDDPQLASLGLDDGYLTTPPGQRGTAFYEPARYDPELVAWDEDNKDVWTRQQWDEQAAIHGRPLDVRVPTLLVMGRHDRFFAGNEVGAQLESGERLAAMEGPKLGKRVPSVDGYILNNAGHSINGARTAGNWYTAAMRWTAERIDEGERRMTVRP